MRKIKGYKNIDCQFFEDDEKDSSPKEFGCWSGILTFYEDDFFMGVVKNFNKHDTPELVVGHLLPNKVVSLIKFNHTDEVVVPELHDAADPELGGKLYSGNYVICHGPENLDTGFSYITLNDIALEKNEQASIGNMLSEALQIFSKCNQDYVKTLFNSLICEDPKDTSERLNFTYNLYACAVPELADACVAAFMFRNFLGVESEFSDLIDLLASLPQLDSRPQSDGEPDKFTDIGELIAGLGLVLDDDGDLSDEEIKMFVDLISESSSSDEGTTEQPSDDDEESKSDPKTKSEE